MDYTIFYKESYENGDLVCDQKYDWFFSGYDDCERTKTIFEKVDSVEKRWFNFPHYNLDFEDANTYMSSIFQEDEYFLNLFKTVVINSDSKICIDITGFIRPHLIFFVLCLHRKGIKEIDFLYSEPQHYENAEETNFSGFVEDVKIIPGCSSSIVIPNTTNDLLIITAGYDNKLITQVTQEKSKVKKKYYILGFPSLQPDMYQESILKLFQVKESIGQRIDKIAPAVDPFVTADVIRQIVEDNPTHSNIYLSPLSTKPQCLGILLYYLWNFNNKPLNIIFPYSNKYRPKTASGIKKTWKYTFELP